MKSHPYLIFFFLLAVRTALVALIAFMPTEPNGALGSLDYKKGERRALAIKSREAAPRVGTPERQKLIDEVTNSRAFFLPTSVLYIPKFFVSISN